MKIGRHTGLEGEDIAAGFLEAMGYTILHRNWRFKWHEVDIIARDGDIIVFAEVKTRSSGVFGQPEAFVDDRKISSLLQAAEEFLQRFDEPTELRFDIVAVTLDPASGRHGIEHFEDAFYGYE
jgi:putative endonuclease